MEYFTNQFNKEFEKFLEEYCKTPKDQRDFEAYKEDLSKGYCENSSTSYELGRFETKSGHPEVFNFEVKEKVELESKIFVTIFDV